MFVRCLQIRDCKRAIQVSAILQFWRQLISWFVSWSGRELHWHRIFHAWNRGLTVMLCNRVLNCLLLHWLLELWSSSRFVDSSPVQEIRISLRIYFKTRFLIPGPIFSWGPLKIIRVEQNPLYDRHQLPPGPRRPKSRKFAKNRKFQPLINFFTAVQK